MAFGKFAKYTPDEIAYNPCRFDLVTELRNWFDFVVAEDKGKHDLRFESQIPSCMVHSDPKHIKFILVNLLQNATKYSADGSVVTLNLALVDSKPSFSVADQGIGIPQDAIEQLYSPFFRANNVEGRPGTGLGLAILKRSAKTLNAAVEVETELNQGTKFTVTLSSTL